MVAPPILQKLLHIAFIVSPYELHMHGQQKHVSLARYLWLNPFSWGDGRRQENGKAALQHQFHAVFTWTQGEQARLALVGELGAQWAAGWLTFLRIQCCRTKLRMLEAQNSSEAKLALAGIFGNTNAAGGYQDTWPKLLKGKDHRANRPLQCRKIEITLGALRALRNNLQRSKAVPVVHSKNGSLLVYVNLGLSTLLFARPASRATSSQHSTSFFSVPMEVSAPERLFWMNPWANTCGWEHLARYHAEAFADKIWCQRPWQS